MAISLHSKTDSLALRHKSLSAFPSVSALLLSLFTYVLLSLSLVVVVDNDENWGEREVVFGVVNDMKYVISNMKSRLIEDSECTGT